MSEVANIAGRAVDLSHPDVAFLASYVGELKRELEGAYQYLEECRRILEASEDEMLIDAIKRRVHSGQGRIKLSSASTVTPTVSRRGNAIGSGSDSASGAGA